MTEMISKNDPEFWLGKSGTIPWKIERQYIYSLEELHGDQEQFDHVDNMRIALRLGNYNELNVIETCPSYRGGHWIVIYGHEDASGYGREFSTFDTLSEAMADLVEAFGLMIE